MHRSAARIGARVHGVDLTPELLERARAFREANTHELPAGTAGYAEFKAKLEGGGNGDGSAFDAQGRLYVTTNPGVQVISPEGKYLGLIPTPRGIITVTFGGKDRKTMFVVARDNATNKDWILGIPTIAQGPKGRAK